MYLFASIQNFIDPAYYPYMYLLINFKICFTPTTDYRAQLHKLKKLSLCLFSISEMRSTFWNLHIIYPSKVFQKFPHSKNKRKTLWYSNKYRFRKLITTFTTSV